MIAYLFVGFVLTLRIADLLLQILGILGHEIADSGEVRPLEVGVQVDLDHTVGNCLLKLILRTSRASVEYKEDGFGI